MSQKQDAKQRPPPTDGGHAAPGGRDRLTAPRQADDGRGNTASVGAAFECRLGALCEARAWVRSALASWGVKDEEGVIVLALNELATNAVVHAHSPFTVRLDRTTDAVVVGVRDKSGSAPVRLVLDHSSERGRGLAMVQSVSLDSGVEDHGPGGGKTVWALFPTADRGSPSPQVLDITT